MKTTEPIQAVILVGGEGTRLRPLTYTTVKAMVPVLNKPYIEYLIEHLSSHRIKESILAMGYRPDSIKEYFKDRTDFAKSLIYSLEQTPLGTAGAVKNAADYIKKDRAFFVINGDIFTNLDFTAMIRFHHKVKAKVTIALTPVEDPSRFGVVDIDHDQRIHRFVEKPARNEAPSNLVNAGTYILEPEILERIPESKKFMFEHDVFPKLIADGLPVYGYPSSAYWTDIGTPETYAKLNYDLLLGLSGLKKTIKQEIAIEKSSSVHPQAKLIGPIVVGANCSIGQGAQLDGPLIIGQNSNIGTNAKIHNSIL